MLDIRRREVTSTKKKLAKVVTGFASIILFVALMLLCGSIPFGADTGRFQWMTNMTRAVGSLLDMTMFELGITSVITFAASVCVIILADRIK